MASRPRLRRPSVSACSNSMRPVGYPVEANTAKLLIRRPARAGLAQVDFTWVEAQLVTSATRTPPSRERRIPLLYPEGASRASVNCGPACSSACPTRRRHLGALAPPPAREGHLPHVRCAQHDPAAPRAEAPHRR